MKFRSFIIVFQALYWVSFSAFSQVEFRTDSIYTESRNPSNVLELNRKVIFSFENGGIRQSDALFLNRPFGTEVWNNQLQGFYTWNENNDPLSSEFYTWNGTDWTPSSRSEMTYNLNELKDTIYSYAHNGTDWYYTSRNTYTYNVDNAIHQEKLENYSGGWVNSSLATMTYDGLLLSSQLSQTWNGIGWDDSSRNTMTYNSMDLLETLLTELWETNTWVNYVNGLYNYTTGGLLESRSQNLWNSGTASWDNYSFISYTYNENDYLIEVLIQLWLDIGNGLEWVSQSKNTYYPSELLNIKDSMTDNLSVFPNPFISDFTIKLKNPLEKNGNFKLYSVQGDLVYEGKLMAGTKTLSYSNPIIAEGLYIGTVEVGGTKTTFKIIKK